MTKTAYKPLALLAEDRDDLQVMAAHFQDAVLKVRDMAYLPKAKRFALVANRFVWEEGAKKTRGPFTRVRAGLHFDDVLGVRQKAIRQDAPSAVLSLLNIEFEETDDGAGTVTLRFAGGGAIALDVVGLSAEARDISAPWATRNKPDHGA